MAYSPQPSVISSRDVRTVQYLQVTDVINHINNTKVKNHMVFLNRCMESI